MNKIREGYKETEIGVIPEDWEALTVEKISVFVKDGSHGSHKDVEDGIPLLSAKDIIDNTIKIPTDCRKISISDYNKLHKNYELQIDDVLITIVGTIGRTAIVKSVEKKFTLQRSVGIVRPNNLINAEYLKQFMSGKIFQNQLKNSVNASAQGGVYLKTLSNLTCFVPQLPEQQRIAEILSTTDEHIEKLDEIIEDYQLLKKGMTKKLLTEGIGHTEFKETEIGRIPKEWEVRRIEDISEILDSRRKPLNSSERNAMKGNIPYYGANGVVDYINDYLFDEDLILLAEDGGNFTEFATRPIAYKISGKSWVNNHAHILRPNSELSFNWMFYSLQHKDITDFVQGGTRAKLNQKDLRRILIPIPSIEEQEAYSNAITDLDNRISLFMYERSDFIELKKSLMEKLLTGKVRTI